MTFLKIFLVLVLLAIVMPMSLPKIRRASLTSLPSRMSLDPRIIAVIIGIHLLVLWQWPSWWVLMAKNVAFWVIQVLALFTFVYLVDYEGYGIKKTRKLNTWGNIALGALTIVSIWNVGIWLMWSNSLGPWEEWNKQNPTEAPAGYVSTPTKSQEHRPSQDAPKSSPFVTKQETRAPLPPTKNVEGEKRVREFWEKELGKGPDADEMVDIAQRESDFNQFEKDGKTVYRRRPTPDNPETDDVCVMQDNEVYWKKEVEMYGDKFPEIRSYDLYTWDGCLKAAAHLRRHYKGSWLWTTSGMRTFTTTTYNVVVGDEWSAEVPTPQGHFPKITYAPSDVVLIQTSEGKVFVDHPGVQTPVGNPQWLKFRSGRGDKKDITVFVTPR